MSGSKSRQSKIKFELRPGTYELSDIMNTLGNAFDEGGLSEKILGKMIVQSNILDHDKLGTNFSNAIVKYSKMPDVAELLTDHICNDGTPFRFSAEVFRAYTTRISSDEFVGTLAHYKTMPMASFYFADAMANCIKYDLSNKNKEEGSSLDALMKNLADDNIISTLIVHRRCKAFPEICQITAIALQNSIPFDEVKESFFRSKSELLAFVDSLEFTMIDLIGKAGGQEVHGLLREDAEANLN